MARSSPQKYQNWKHRLAAIAFGSGIVLTAEAICRLSGWGEANPVIDPFVSFSNIERLFELNVDSRRFETRAERKAYFIPDSFAARKDERTFRVFCLGGSTVQGRPYSTATAFSRWLQLSLESAYPDRSFEIVNGGGISYASYRLVPILDECLAYEPDLFILCTGHNEFLEDRTYATVKRWRWYLEHAARPASRSHLYRCLVRVATNRAQVDAVRPILKNEVDALLDHECGLESYRRDEAWRAGVIRHFNQNLRRMIRLASDREVPLLVMAPPVNLKDCPPFKSEPTPGITIESQKARDQLLRLANARRQSSPRQVAHLLAQAVAVDPENAGLHYALGHGYLISGDVAGGRRAFADALEMDICPLRMLRVMREEMEATCVETDTRFIDLQRLFEQTEATTILGTGVLVDHIHPSIRGHQLIANRITERLEGWVLPTIADDQKWFSARSAAYDRHLDSLDALYYAHGRQRLENLQHWTEGRAEGLPIKMRSSAAGKNDKAD